MIKPVLVIVKKYFVILYTFIFLTVARIVRASKVATRTSVVKATKNTHLYKNHNHPSNGWFALSL